MKVKILMIVGCYLVKAPYASFCRKQILIVLANFILGNQLYLADFFTSVNSIQKASNKAEWYTSQVEVDVLAISFCALVLSDNILRSLQRQSQYELKLGVFNKISLKI